MTSKQQLESNLFAAGFAKAFHQTQRKVEGFYATEIGNEKCGMRNAEWNKINAWSGLKPGATFVEQTPGFKPSIFTDF